MYKMRTDDFVSTVKTGLFVKDSEKNKIDICMLSAESLVHWMNKQSRENLEIALMRAFVHPLGAWTNFSEAKNKE